MYNKSVLRLVPRLSTWCYPLPQLGHLQLLIDSQYEVPAAVDQYLLPMLMLRHAAHVDWRDRQTDGRTVNRCIEPAMHTEQAASVMYTLHHTAVRQWSLVLMLPASINGYILCCISQLSDYWWHPAMDWMKKLLHLFVVQHYHIIVCCRVCFSRITCIA